jgi:hypothetical protein
MIYVCTRCYESGGKMWPVYFLCINTCLAIFVAFTSCMLLFKKANLQVLCSHCVCVWGEGGLGV